MSTVRYVSVACDKCPQQTAYAVASARAIRAKAKENGWKLGKSKDFCPSCAAEIAEAVKAAQAGNL